MIIFDLDGTLADCQHRWHFVDPKEHPNTPPIYWVDETGKSRHIGYENPFTGEKWKPDWPAFEEACDEDVPVRPVVSVFNFLLSYRRDIEIWSGRSEIVREKTYAWLRKYAPLASTYPID